MRNLYMRKGQFPALLIVAMIFASCEFKCQLGNPDKKNEAANDTTQTGGNKSGNLRKSLNGIELNAKDVTVQQAYLALESGDLISSDNTVSLGEKVVLTINSNGWKNVDGKSFIGISQTITTHSGATVLETGDMFAKYDDTGINAEYASLLKLKAYITETKPDIEYFNVVFRVWDKKGDGEITGKYKFYVK